MFKQLKKNAMKNLMYVLAIAVMGLVACGAPAEKGCAADCAKECCAVAPAEETTADTVLVEAEEAEMMDSTATEEVAE